MKRRMKQLIILLAVSCVKVSNFGIVQASKLEEAPQKDAGIQEEAGNQKEIGNQEEVSTQQDIENRIKELVEEAKGSSNASLRTSETTVPFVKAIDSSGERTNGYWDIDESGNKRYYSYDDLDYVKSTWLLDSGAWYYLDGKGYAKTGWLLNNNQWYFLDADGTMATGWVFTNNKWYYLEESGAMAKNCWVEGYYVNGNGEWVVSYNEYVGVWSPYQGSYRFQDKSGKLAKGWKQIRGKWYYFDQNGVMQIGWKKLGGKWYFLSNSVNDGAMKSGLFTENDRTYYLGNRNSGAMQTGWLKQRERWYYFGGADDGQMRIGQQKIGDGVFLFDHDGIMQENTWGGDYYYDSNGYGHEEGYAFVTVANYQAESESYITNQVEKHAQVNLIEQAICELPAVMDMDVPSLGDVYLTCSIDKIGGTNVEYVYDSNQEVLFALYRNWLSNDEIMEDVVGYKIDQEQVRLLFSSVVGEEQEYSVYPEIQEKGAICMFEIDENGEYTDNGFVINVTDTEPVGVSEEEKQQDIVTLLNVIKEAPKASLFNRIYPKNPTEATQKSEKGYLLLYMSLTDIEVLPYNSEDNCFYSNFMGFQVPSDVVTAYFNNMIGKYGNSASMIE